MDPNLSNVDFRDFWFLAPGDRADGLGAGGAAGRPGLGAADERTQPAAGAIGWLSLAGVALALLAAAVV